MFIWENFISVTETNRNFSKEKSYEARSWKPSQSGWTGLYEEALLKYLFRSNNTWFRCSCLSAVALPVECYMYVAKVYNAISAMLLRSTMQSWLNHFLSQKLFPRPHLLVLSNDIFFICIRLPRNNSGSLCVSGTGFITWVNIENIRGEVQVWKFARKLKWKSMKLAMWWVVDVLNTHTKFRENSFRSSLYSEGKEKKTILYSHFLANFQN